MLMLVGRRPIAWFTLNAGSSSAERLFGQYDTGHADRTELVHPCKNSDYDGLEKEGEAE